MVLLSTQQATDKPTLALTAHQLVVQSGDIRGFHDHRVEIAPRARAQILDLCQAQVFAQVLLVPGEKRSPWDHRLQGGKRKRTLATLCDGLG